MVFGAGKHNYRVFFIKLIPVIFFLVSMKYYHIQKKKIWNYKFLRDYQFNTCQHIVSGP